MHGHHANITKVNLLLTEPSQVSEVGPREGGASISNPKNGTLSSSYRTCIPTLLEGRRDRAKQGAIVLLDSDAFLA